MPDCPECGLGGYVLATELGYLCTFCLHHWPYDRFDLGEPTYDFQEYRAWCELVDAKAMWAEIDFVQWLYSDANTKGRNEMNNEGER